MLYLLWKSSKKSNKKKERKNPSSYLHQVDAAGFFSTFCGKAIKKTEKKIPVVPTIP
jgi:hypothetical protein